MDAVMSLGMVGLSNTKHASEIMIPAAEKYHLALRATNSALRDVEQAKADQTLITVMLLGLYEVDFTFVSKPLDFTYTSLIRQIHATHRDR